jgi:hypothetical protein
LFRYIRDIQTARIIGIVHGAVLVIVDPVVACAELRVPSATLAGQVIREIDRSVTIIIDAVVTLRIFDLASRMRAPRIVREVSEAVSVIIKPVVTRESRLLLRQVFGAGAAWVAQVGETITVVVDAVLARGRFGDHDDIRHPNMPTVLCTEEVGCSTAVECEIRYLKIRSGDVDDRVHSPEYRGALRRSTCECEVVRHIEIPGLCLVLVASLDID